MFCETGLKVIFPNRFNKCSSKFVFSSLHGHVESCDVFRKNESVATFIVSINHTPASRELEYDDFHTPSIISHRRHRQRALRV